VRAHSRPARSTCVVSFFVLVGAVAAVLINTSLEGGIPTANSLEPGRQPPARDPATQSTSPPSVVLSGEAATGARFVAYFAVGASVGFVQQAPYISARSPVFYLGALRQQGAAGFLSVPFFQSSGIAEAAPSRDPAILRRLALPSELASSVRHSSTSCTKVWVDFGRRRAAPRPAPPLGRMPRRTPR
jgi:hypothetical protein